MENESENSPRNVDDDTVIMVVCEWEWFMLLTKGIKRLICVYVLNKEL